MRSTLVPSLLVLVSMPALLAAQDRLVRRFGGERGLVSTVVALAQDSTGFLWAGTRGGLFRYDGRRFERWAPEALPRAVGSVAVSPTGRVVVVDADGRILELTGRDVTQLPGTARRSPGYLHVAAFDARGRLWIVTREGNVAWQEEGDITRGEDGDGWRRLPRDALAGDTTRRVFPDGAEGGILLAGGEALWSITPGQSPERLLNNGLVVDAGVLPDGRTVALTSDRRVLAIDRAGRAEELTADADLPPMRGISLAERDGTLWLASDRYLVALAPDGTAEVLGSEQEVAAGGPVLVDHEGSLWHAGFTTLSQYPEPRTGVWGERHGLPSGLTRYLGRTGDAMWVTTWQEPGMLRQEAGRWDVETPPLSSARGVFCGDGAGGLRVAGGPGVHHLRGHTHRFVAEFPRGFNSCARASGGGTWVGTGEGLYHMSPDGTLLTPVSSFPSAPRGRAIQAVLEDRSGRLRVGSYERVCEASARAVRTEAAVEWVCEPLPPGTVHLNVMVELDDGATWGASTDVGVLRRGEDGWRVMPHNRTLPSRAVLNLVPSPRGGVWLVGNGFLRRVRGAGEDGWVVLEELGHWHGLPTVGGGDLLEEEDGTVWIATAGGLVRVPGSVRTQGPRPPRMALVEARVDGERVPLNQPLVLPADRNRLELRFAGLTFRDPTRVRYQVRLSPEDEWTDTDGEPVFRWVDLPAGRHRPQVRASLDGVTWSPAPAELAFRVLPPWYRTPWAVGAFLLVGAGLLFAVYRLRLAYLLGLERQRTRIAMDLHDEMGSGLASIGILAGVMSAEAEAPARDHGLAREVAATAEELGTALSDIVWSLDPRSATLEELAARLAEHGGRLFADEVEFDTGFPARWPPEPLPLPVLRNVLLVGLEALHNAARHAGARRVRLSLWAEGDMWVLAVEDDGVGLPSRDEGSGGWTGRGRGCQGMQRRAAEIGGEVAWESGQGEGTAVRMRFPLPRRAGPFGRWLGTWLAPWRNGGPAAPDPDLSDPHEHASAAESPPTHR